MSEASREGDQVARAKRKAAGGDGVKNRKAQHPIDWATWWPFTRATDEALKQLNRRQPNKQLDDLEEALL